MQKKRILWFCTLSFLAAFLCSACSTDSSSTDTSDKTETISDTPTIGQSEKPIRLGNSAYAVKVSGDLEVLRVSNAQWEEHMKSHYSDLQEEVDFAVYQFPKEDHATPLKKFIRKDANDHGATQIETDLELNGTAAACYYATEMHDGEALDGITFVLDTTEDYLKVDFRFIAETSEEKAWNIMRSLQVIETSDLELSNYHIQLPSDFIRLDDAEDGTFIYKSCNGSIYLYIKQSEADEGSLSDFIPQENVSNIENDTEINGIPVVLYRSEKICDGAYRSFWNCLFQEPSSGFTTLSFRLDGITAEEQAQDILNTLSSSGSGTSSEQEEE